MQPHIILLMVSEYNISNAVEAEEIIETDESGLIIVFKSFEEAKKHQDAYAINGRVVPLSIY